MGTFFLFLFFFYFFAILVSQRQLIFHFLFLELSFNTFLVSLSLSHSLLVFLCSLYSFFQGFLESFFFLCLFFLLFAHHKYHTDCCINVLALALRRHTKEIGVLVYNLKKQKQNAKRKKLHNKKCAKLNSHFVLIHLIIEDCIAFGLVVIVYCV